MAARHLRQLRQERGQIQVRQIDGAEFFDDAVQVGEQRRVVGVVDLGAGETQQRVGEPR